MDQKTASVLLTNTGDRPGDEVVQLYVRDAEASLTPPINELRGFARVGLIPGESRTVSLGLAAEQLAFVDVPGRWIVEPGTFRIMVGKSSDSLPLETHLVVTGVPRVIQHRERFLTQVAVQ